MKTLITLLVATLAITACNGQSSAVKDQAGVYKKFDEMKKKHTYPTSEDGWTMTCLVDGQPWKAAEIFDPAGYGRIVGNYKESKIGLPDRAVYKLGYKLNFEHSAVDFDPLGSTGLWGGNSGEMEITKVGSDWVEGKFHFTATLMNSSKTMEITNGFFRIPLKNK
jgi:hypothetical protein